MTIVNGGGLITRRKWGPVAGVFQYMNASGNPNNTVNTGLGIEIDGTSRGATLHHLRVGRFWANPVLSINLLCLVIRGQIPQFITAYQNVAANRPDPATNPFWQLGNDLLFMSELAMAFGAPAGDPSYNDPALQRDWQTGYGPTVEAGNFMSILLFPMHVPMFTGAVAEMHATMTALGGPIARDTLHSRTEQMQGNTPRSIPRGVVSGI